MSKPISTFFAELGFPLKNIRWSWGAYSAHGILLRVWDDDRVGSLIKLLSPEFNRSPQTSDGLRERVEHLRLLWGGGLAGYVVVAKAVDETARPREIERFDQGEVYPIASLICEADGTVLAELSEPIPISKLLPHSKRYRVTPADGPFPRSAWSARKDAPDRPYTATLPAMRAHLIEIARRKATITYAEAREPFALRTFEHRHAMDRLGHACLEANEPILTSLIVNPSTGRCSDGFFKEFQRDDQLERSDCYEFWNASSDADHSEDFARIQTEALKFARVAIRSDQAAFRRRVFVRFGGTCAISGCTIRRALDAAHVVGRDWKLGHNAGSDGILLRKDLHALYDAGLIEISSNGTAQFKAEVRDHYRDFHGLSVFAM